ncbi:putative Zn-dependent protease [Gottschalkia purinilytica]|uniref:Putative Zn-dependent protease n=1 Tax=Gottschalkia purinilytica TaxID=1503 RepID=A0A0L0W9J8_GOTPU|nr:metallopeptidase TldD-related protein [Gottschalkia purinilytica]KNF08116.1 putative Zn-dependent protease [Gottschalkia purinilytica]
MIKEKFVINRKETSIGIMQSKIEDIRIKDITRTGLRIYENGFIGVAGAIGEYDEKKLEDEAKKALELKIPYEPSPYENNKHSIVNECNIENSDDFIREIEEVISIIGNKHKKFIFSDKVKLIEIEASLTNDRGLDLYQKDKRIEFTLIVKDKGSKNIIDTFIPYSTRNYNRENFMSFLDSILLPYHNLVELPKKEMLPVIMYNPDFYGMTYMKFINDLNGLSVANEVSIFSGKLGEKLFSEDLTLWLTSRSEDNYELFFDAEGSFKEDYRYALIENGVIKAPYTDKRTSLKYNFPLTASSTGEYDEVPSLEISETIFNKLKLKQGEKTLKELLNGEMGVFIFSASGGDFTPDGVFATPVQQAYLFDGEKFIGRLPEIQISSDLYSMFGKDFRGVSKDTLNEDVNLSYTVIDMKVEKL